MCNPVLSKQTPHFLIVLLPVQLPPIYHNSIWNSELRFIGEQENVINSPARWGAREKRYMTHLYKMAKVEKRKGGYLPTSESEKNTFDAA